MDTFECIKTKLDVRDRTHIENNSSTSPCTTTTDSNITTIIIIKVTIPATIINLLDDPDPEYWDGL
jgi:hypothetical protein